MGVKVAAFILTLLTAASLPGVTATIDRHTWPAPGGVPAEEACAGCHAEEVGAVVHEPYRGGRCGLCHRPGDDGPGHGRLISPVNELCGSCHSFTGGSHPLEEGVTCLSCHRPHASENRALLVERGDGLCLECHEFG